MTDELKPCPFCGSEDIGYHCEIGTFSSWCYCFCPKCGETGSSAPSQEQARAAWNAMQEEADSEHE